MPSCRAASAPRTRSSLDPLGGRDDAWHGQQHELPAPPFGDELLVEGVGGVDFRLVPRLPQYHDPLKRLGFLGITYRVFPVHFSGQHIGAGAPVLAGVGHGGLQVGFQLAGGITQQLVEVALGVEGEQLAGVVGGVADEQQVAFELGHRPLHLVQVVDLYIRPHGAGSLSLVVSGERGGRCPPPTG